jgi:anaerobic selenocysteine-containing dehydrogenase
MSEQRHSVCALDCPDTCSLLVDIDNQGRATRLRGDPNHPVTRGFLCGKVARYLDREYHPDRVLYPMRRTGTKGEGRFERITWDAALDEIAKRFAKISAQHGPEAILPYSYGGTLGMLNGGGMDRRFFHRLGASRLNRTICSAAGGEALKRSQGIKLGTEPEQFRHSKLIIAWGANILGTNVHLWPWIVEARRNGARFYVIDPVRNRTGRAADRYFAINPGSDLALALGLSHVILRDGLQDASYIASYANGLEAFACLASRYPPERVAGLTGIAAADIEALAREYATTRPSVIRLNYGVQRSERGGAAVHAISALPVLTGSWREPGGGMQLSTSGAFEFDEVALQRPDLQFESPLGRQARILNMVELGRALNDVDDPPVFGLFVYNSNPAAVAPHQSEVIRGLRREDLFTVVLDHFCTDTACYADLLLPATTFLEHTDLYLAYGHYYLQLARPAVPPPGEAKSNFEVFRLLAKRMGFQDFCFGDSEEDVIRAALSSNSAFLDGITLERLEQERFIRIAPAKPGEPFLPFASGGFRTPSGLFEFGAENLEYTPPCESRRGDEKLRRRFPLELISSKNDDSLNSSFGYRPDVDRQTAVLQIHPNDALARGIKDGMQVELFNDRGHCRFVAKISYDVSPGTVWARSMRWIQRTPGSIGVNQLTSPRLTDIGGGPTFYSCLVELRPAEVLSVPAGTISA